MALDEQNGYSEQSGDDDRSAPAQPSQPAPVSPVQPARSVYEQQRQTECAPYQEAYEGSLNALFCVVSHAAPSEPEQRALMATATHEGFVAQDIIWIATHNLDASGLATLIESVDPLCVVVLDQRTAEKLSRAYNQPFKLESCDTVLGRPCCCFVDFARMLETDSRKQRAWALLKEMLSCIRFR